MNKLKAVFWDVDGTIADTEIKGHRLAFNRAFKDYGLNWHWNQQQYIGLLKISGGLKRIRYFSNINNYGLDDELIRKIQKRKQIYYMEIIQMGHITLREGVLRLINNLNQCGVIQCIVTTSSSNTLTPLIAKLFTKELNYFSEFITYEDVEHHKPDPDAYNLALDRTKLTPSDCLVIEDSLIGLKASKRANIKELLTLSPWLTACNDDMRIASSAVNHLGDINSPCSVFFGPKCPQNKVDYNYLESLLN